MSLVHKIPPLVSALAFGYGVGMAAPESTIARVQGAVDGYRAASGAALAAKAGAGRDGPAPIRLKGLEGTDALGGESEELARLRERARREGLASSGERPTESRAPAYVSRPDGEAEDIDELDVAGHTALSRLQLPDLPLTITKRTLKYVRFFTRTDKGRGMFQAWLRRSGKYQEMIQRELRDRRLPEDLIWLAMIESGFDARARSPAGAVGLWQFMPATGAVYGLQQTRYVDQRRNPRLATQAAAHHLRDLYMRFGDWNLALAAYNMGYEQLLDRIDRYGTADFSELARQEALPRETAAYVPKIAAAAIVANNLERFGFDRVELQRPVLGAEIAVPGGIGLKVVAQAAGISLAQLRTLNPDVLGERLPSGRSDFLVQVPADTVSHALAALPALLASADALTDDASVLDPGDLLGGRAFEGPSPSRRAVGAGDESLLSLLPKPKKRRAMRDKLERLTELEEALAAIASGKGGGGDDPEPRRGASGKGKRKGRQTVFYRVGSGDTLIGVARHFAMDVDDVASENALEPDAQLQRGALLKLHVRADLLEGVAALPLRGALAPAPEAPRPEAPRPEAPRPAGGPAPEAGAAKVDPKRSGRAEASGRASKANGAKRKARAGERPSAPAAPKLGAGRG